jgi:uncharacterized protein (DUF924 family)
MTETLPDTWADDVLRFWFHELSDAQWFKVDPALDETIRQRFAALYTHIARDVPEDAYGVASTALATVIVLDQFPRNMFRGTPQAFATDPKALAVATDAVDLGIDVLLTPEERWVLYLPFEHSEDRAVQARSVDLMAKIGNDFALDYAQRHQVIVDRFGRFPHRNAILGRASTAEELTFLAGPNSSF